MSYNPIRKIKDGEFSIKEDGLQTLKDVYKYTGIDLVVGKLEKDLEVLKEGDKLFVESYYAIGTGLIAVSIATKEPLIAIFGLGYYALAHYHCKSTVKIDRIVFLIKGDAKRVEDLAQEIKKNYRNI